MDIKSSLASYANYATTASNSAPSATSTEAPAAAPTQQVIAGEQVHLSEQAMQLLSGENGNTGNTGDNGDASPNFAGGTTLPPWPPKKPT